jgi:hypothetical protein
MAVDVLSGRRRLGVPGLRLCERRDAAVVPSVLGDPAVTTPVEVAAPVATSLTVDHALIPPLSPEEHDQLEHNLLAAGQALDPLACWHGILLDGHNRHAICERHGLPSRQQHELLYIAIKGQPPCPLSRNMSASVVHEPRGRHSERPAAFYDVIERMYPEFKKRELFARHARAGWEPPWGNQAPAGDAPAFG